MPADFLPILILAALAVVMSVVAIVLSSFLGPHKPSPSKLASYESGMVPIGDARLRFSVRFLVVAILFILFDVQIFFLYPWAVYFRRLGFFGLVEAVVFLGVVGIGYLYAWRKGGLEWD
ncbi:MAG: NADH-quinone oxidoreductase subunit A [Anaerolineae bacterium]